jgi:hypothetical protein
MAGLLLIGVDWDFSSDLLLVNGARSCEALLRLFPEGASSEIVELLSPEAPDPVVSVLAVLSSVVLRLIGGLSTSAAAESALSLSNDRPAGSSNHETAVRSASIKLLGPTGLCRI